MRDDETPNYNLAPKTFNNVTNFVINDIKKTIQSGSKVSLAAASFSIYAYAALEKELDTVESLRFIFTADSFTKNRPERQSREFYIPRLSRERSLYGTDFEIKLRNELSQAAIARECAAWVKRKAEFRANKTGENMPSMLVVDDRSIDQKENDTLCVYNPFNNFTTAELGLDRGHNIYSAITKLGEPSARQLLDNFNAVWNDHLMVEDVTENVLENISTAYKENSPELIYFLALYNIFNEFLEDINGDNMPNEATGFKNSKIWSLLYDFQKDAVIGCISKLEKHNGCILADSVGLGKTFSALGVIKYYESRNKSVLVLCPKRLADNWNTFKGNYRNNPIREDRLNYDVLYHTDVGRDGGSSNGIDLDRLEWGNYDLVVIDESHNFRNGAHSTHRKDENYENRYQKLMRRVIKSGVKTKVLMLSATPVNTDFTDLKNQLMIAAEGDSGNLAGTLKTKNSVDKIFADAQAVFRDWSELPATERTTENLLARLDFDFFELLDSVTIARSRKHIQTYYNSAALGNFPERMKPENHRPELTDLADITYNTLFEYIDRLNLAIYTPLLFVQKSRLAKYVDPNRTNAKTWENREAGRNELMTTNLLKRAESSIYAFRLTAQRIYDFIDSTISTIDAFAQGRGGAEIGTQQFSDDEDSDEDVIAEGMSVGRKMKIDLADMDYKSWRAELEKDAETLNELLEKIKNITQEHDEKLKKLREVMREKFAEPINSGNKKILVFTAFSDTAKYLYENLSPVLKEKYGLNSALVSGTETETNLTGLKKDFNHILTVFSPESKNRAALFQSENPGDIDVLFATDCISEGQNLQDCDEVVNYDIHWNPVRIIQRFGRIDRIGSRNARIKLVNFWPNITLDAYINLKDRVENRMKLVTITGTGEDTLENSDPELEYRKNQLEKLQREVVDLEDMSGGVNIMDLGLNEFRLDLQSFVEKYGEADGVPHGISAVAASTAECPPGVIFVLRNVNPGINIDKQNRLHPFYLVYIADDGKIVVNHLDPKDLLSRLRMLAGGKDQPLKSLVAEFNAETADGKKMSKYSALLGDAIASIVTVKSEKDVDSLFRPGGTTARENEIRGLNDFELIDFLVVK